MVSTQPQNPSLPRPAIAERVLAVAVAVLLVGLVLGVWVHTWKVVKAENMLRQGRFLAQNSPTSNKRLQLIQDALKTDSTSLEARQDLARFRDNETKLRFQSSQYNLIREEELLSAYSQLDALIGTYPYQPRILRQKADFANILSVYYQQIGDTEKATAYTQDYFDFYLRSYRQVPVPLETPKAFLMDVLISSNNSGHPLVAAEVLGFTETNPLEWGVGEDPRGRQVILNTWMQLRLYPLLYDELYKDFQRPEDQLPLLRRYCVPLMNDPYARDSMLFFLRTLKGKNQLGLESEIFLKDLESLAIEEVQPKP